MESMEKYISIGQWKNISTETYFHCINRKMYFHESIGNKASWERRVVEIDGSCQSVKSMKFPDIRVFPGNP